MFFVWTFCSIFNRIQFLWNGDETYLPHGVNFFLMAAVKIFMSNKVAHPLLWIATLTWWGGLSFQ